MRFLNNQKNYFLLKLISNFQHFSKSSQFVLYQNLNYEGIGIVLQLRSLLKVLILKKGFLFHLYIYVREQT